MVTRFRLSRLHRRPASRSSSVAPEAVLRRAGLPPGCCGEEQHARSRPSICSRSGAAVGDDRAATPPIGLRLGSEDRDRALRSDPARGALGVVVSATRSSAPRDTSSSPARRRSASSPRGRDVRAVQFQLAAASARPSRRCSSTCALRGCSRSAGAARAARLTPLRRRVQPRNRQHAELYRAYFGCPVDFGAAAQRAGLRAAAISTGRFVTHNTELLGMLAPQLEAELAEPPRKATTRAIEVKGVVKRLLAGRRPDLDEVARALGASIAHAAAPPRRRGVTFQQVLEEARRELAHHYLLHSSLDLSEIAYLARLRGRELVLPRLPSVGRRAARTLARAASEASQTDAGVSRHAAYGRSRTDSHLKGLWKGHGWAGRYTMRRIASGARVSNPTPSAR